VKTVAMQRNKKISVNKPSLEENSEVIYNFTKYILVIQQESITKSLI